MKQRDRDNLKFLLEANPETLDDWYEQASEDDIEYADSLLTMLELELLDAAVIDHRDCEETKQILKKFTKV